jgi:ketosteroid isomerase-like protein
MPRSAMSRRVLLDGGICAAIAIPVLANAADSAAWSRLGARNTSVIRKWYAAWEQKDWAPLDALLADDFTFTSANDDDHISKSAFKTRCWTPNIDFIERFDLESVFGGGDQVFVKYLCHTKNGKYFRNVEFVRLRDEKLVAIECYFGEKSSFPSAVSAGPS